MAVIRECEICDNKGCRICMTVEIMSGMLNRARATIVGADPYKPIPKPSIVVNTPQR